MNTAIVFITTAVDRVSEVAEEIAAIDGVTEVYSVTGEIDLVALVRTRDVASIADIVRQDRNGGPAIAAVQMSSDLGSIIGPIIAGVLVDEGSYGLAFAVTGLIGLLAVIPWLRARETANVA